jgi:SAM-dependent methyltransferase
MTKHREALKEQLGRIHLNDVAVIDWGAGSKPASRYINSENCTFYTIDKSDYDKPDLVADITKELNPGKVFDVAFCLEVIEHVEDVKGLIYNLQRYLTASGVLYMSVPFQFEIHAEEDYWRFTEHGIRLLLEPHFTNIEITSIDGDSGYFVKAVR